MVENIEEFGPELGGEPFSELPALGHGQIHVADTGVAEIVARRRAEGAQGRRNQSGITLKIATVLVERGQRRRVNTARCIGTGSPGSRALSTGQYHLAGWG